MACSSVVIYRASVSSFRLALMSYLCMLHLVEVFGLHQYFRICHVTFCFLPESLLSVYSRVGGSIQMDALCWSCRGALTHTNPHNKHTRSSEGREDNVLLEAYTVSVFSCRLHNTNLRVKKWCLFKSNSPQLPSGNILCWSWSTEEIISEPVCGLQTSKQLATWNLACVFKELCLIYPFRVIILLYYHYFYT